MENEKYKNIIWDVDGTLFDTYPAMVGAFQAALGSFGKSADPVWIEDLAKTSLNVCAASMAERFSIDEDAIAQAFEDQYKAKKLEEQLPFPGVKAVCETILAMGGKNVIVAHRGKTSTEALLAAHSMGGFFAGCLTGNDGYPRKPDPATFMAAVQLFNLNPAETLTVGDRDIDIQAGKAARIFTCLFGSESDRIDADLKIMNFNELQAFLFSNNEDYPLR